MQVTAQLKNDLYVVATRRPSKPLALRQKIERVSVNYKRGENGMTDGGGDLNRAWEETTGGFAR